MAGLGSRFLALFADLLLKWLAIAMVAFIAFVLGVPTFSTLGPKGRMWVVALLLVGYFLIDWAYFAGFEIYWKGQTPGKRATGLRVINESGREAQVFESVIRNLLRPIDALPFGYAIGAIVMFISPQHKRIGDYAAGTIVIHDRKPSEDQLFFNTQESAVSHELAYSKLTATEVQTIELFLQRRLDLEMAVRKSTAFRLAQHFGNKLSVPAEERRDDENFLEMLALGFRQSASYSTVHQ
ncbi:MAG TPA: RDD family protein [Terriglobales bacterium]